VGYVLLILLGVATIGLLVPFLFYKLRKPNWMSGAGGAEDGGSEPPPAEQPPGSAAPADA
jgi:hypothetical protein